MQIEKCINEFKITRRPTLPLEMMTYLKFVEMSNLSAETKWRKLCEAALCAEVMNSDVNYHVLLEDVSVARYIAECLERIGEKLLQMERQKQHGTLLIVFNSSPKGLGVFCVSSHHRPDSDQQWDRYLHYNSNACACEEVYQLLQLKPPQQLHPGVVFEEVFTGVVQRNLFLTFTTRAIEQKRASLNREALDVMDRGLFHDESHLGKKLNLGHINWVVHSEDGLELNHLLCEAALCNASPLVALTLSPHNKLAMAVTFASILTSLQNASLSFYQLQNKK